MSDNWPVGCHDPDSCARHEGCMYTRCRHEGHDIAEVIRYRKAIWDANQMNDKGEIPPS